MAFSTISQKELEESYEAIEQATHAGPVLITKDGEPRSVLMDIAEYRRLTGVNLEGLKPTCMSVADLLAVPAGEDFDWEPPRLDVNLRPAGLD